MVDSRQWTVSSGRYKTVKEKMKTVILLGIMMFMIAQQALSNNVQVSNVRLTNQNTTDDFTMVEFDIIWKI